MASAFVQVQADGPGKKVQTFENTVGGQLVEAQAVVAVDTTGAAIAPALDATLTGGTAKSIARGGAKGATAAADVTSTASGANHQGADVCLYDAAGNLIDPRSIRALTSNDVVSTVQAGVRSAANSSAANLGISATFTGTFENVNNYAFISFSIFADQASAVDGLKFDWSDDGVNTDVTEVSDVLASTGRAFAIVPRAQFFRVRYVNGAVATGALRIGTVYHQNGTGIITKPADASFTTENFVEQTRSVIVGKDEAGTGFSNVHGATGAPAAGDVGLVVRNIPSGTQNDNVTQFGGTNLSTGTGVGGAGIPRVTVSSDSVVGVTPPTLTKGTQAATGFSTQDLKDSGRVTIMWTAEVAGAATTEGLLTVTESRDGAATTTFTTKVVTNGKRLRITSLQIAIETLGTGTAPQRVYLRLRFNTAGAVTTGSPLQGTWECVNNAAIVKSGATYDTNFPDGIEFAGDGTKQIGFTIQFPDWVTTTATVQAKITVTGFEY